MTERNTIVRTSFPPIEADEIGFLLKAYKISKPQDLIRFLVSQAAKTERDNIMRYQKSDGIPKQTKADRELETIAKLEAMSDKELTEHLYAAGLKDFDKAFRSTPDDPNVTRNFIGPVSSGGRGWVQETVNDSIPGAKPYFREVYGWQELVSYLKKQRIIK